MAESEDIALGWYEFVNYCIHRQNVAIGKSNTHYSISLIHLVPLNKFATTAVLS